MSAEKFENFYIFIIIPTSDFRASFMFIFLYSEQKAIFPIQITEFKSLSKGTVLPNCVRVDLKTNFFFIKSTLAEVGVIKLKARAQTLKGEYLIVTQLQKLDYRWTFYSCQNILFSEKSKVDVLLQELKRKIEGKRKVRRAEGAKVGILLQ